jgi:cell division protein FtsI/penicillin-binding protein 2
VKALSMVHVEVNRITALGAMLGILLVLVLGRLVQLQVGRPSEIDERVVRRSWIVERQPGPRQRIVGRDEALLAYDRPVVDVRAEVTLPFGAEEGAKALERLVRDLHVACARDADALGGLDRVDALRDRLRESTSKRWAAAVGKAQARAVEAAQAAGLAEPKPPRSVRIEFLVAGSVDSVSLLEALRARDYRRMGRRDRSNFRKERGYLVAIHEIPTHVREQPERELTAGFVGVMHGSTPRTGLEKALVARAPSILELRKVDALRRSYWADVRVLPSEDERIARDIRLTVDMGLQRAADRLLEEAAANVAERFEDLPEWGALVLVEVATGDVLAFASFGVDRAGRPAPFGAFAPLQRAYEPGSVVKPLHIALGLQRGLIDWTEQIDCNDDELPSRAIVDSHECGWQTPFGVLVNSSNIGAVKLGMRLGPDGLDDYLDLFQFGVPTDIGLPGELAGERPRIVDAAPRDQRIYVGPSVCFGYQMTATTLQLARAYLTLVSGRQRGLRLLADRPEPSRGERFLDRSVVDAVLSAMTAVVDGADGSTAPVTTRMLRDLDIPEGLIAGKTGTTTFTETVRETAEDGSPELRRLTTKIATFVGLAPAADPRFIAVGAIQKRQAVSFYGGRYTGPYVTRLLLRALVEDVERAASDGQRIAQGAGAGGFDRSGLAGASSSRRGRMASPEVIR